MPIETHHGKQHFRLASHVRGCYCNGQVILLDLRRNKYIGVGGPHLHALAAQVEGWPQVPMSEGVPATSHFFSVAATHLVSEGLVTHSRPGHRADRTIEPATASLADTGSDALARIGTRRYWSFFRSAAEAGISMRFRSLQFMANAVATRREKHERNSVESSSLEAIARGVAAYETLRPFVFTARDKCLQDSLALIGFLASAGLFPHWVIGVKTRPFGAHSWVQFGPTVLNDHHDHVRQFVPILVA